MKERTISLFDGLGCRQIWMHKDTTHRILLEMGSAHLYGEMLMFVSTLFYEEVNTKHQINLVKLMLSHKLKNQKYYLHDPLKDF